MEAVNLTSRTQRYGLLALTVLLPFIWLIGLANVMSSSVWVRFAVLPAFPAFLVSAAGALAAIRHARGGRPASWLQRHAIYLVWGWLTPFCLIVADAVADFAWLWPALAILALPAPAFLFVRLARERFLGCAAACGALACLALLASSEAPLSFQARLLVPLLISVGPLWSLAGYVALQEHVVDERLRAPGGEREIGLAALTSLVGILLFFCLGFGMVMLSLRGMQ